MNTTARRERCSRVSWISALALLVVLPSGASAGVQTPCYGITIETEAGSELDDGTTGRAHNQPVTAGSLTTWAVSKCSAGDQGPCVTNGDCAAGTCNASCDCASDTSCNLAGPIDGRKCLANMAACTTNADCPSSGACVLYFGPPQPLSYDETPLCALTHFDGAASGTYDTGTGDVSLSGLVRRRYYSGIDTDQPCPRCGAPEVNPVPGDQYTCEGGARGGQPCTVEGVTPYFGGTSSDCPPSAAALVSGISGVAIRLSEVASSPQVKTAGFQCAGVGFTANPTAAGSNPKCTDDVGGPVCTSNADCKRCSADITTACNTNADCTGKGSCSTAPDQPVTCGFWCHCGFCNNDGNKPCFGTGDCAQGETCQKGTGSSSASNIPQQKPNDCSSDAFICGTGDSERCEDTTIGRCSELPYRKCTINADCEVFSAGTCVLQGKPCFGSRIARSGTSDPLGANCAFEDKACSSNADCMGEGDFCVLDTSRAELAGVYCMAGTTSSAINSTQGFSGPGAVDLDVFVKACRCVGTEPGCEAVCGEAGAPDCGNGMIESGEDCDGGVCCDESCAFRSSAAVCRGASGVCDLAESCTGSSSTCPGNTLASTAVACRASGGVCDLPENCDGTSTQCPANTFAPSTTACRSSAGICDVAESCSGTSATCPGNALASSTTVCRASAGQCDAEETCTGGNAACPVDGDKIDGTACNDGDECTTNDECTGGDCDGTSIPQCGGVCGDGSVNEGEACDDGNATFTQGEYCGVACVLIPCGKPTNSAGELPTTTDALFILRVSVGQRTCSPRVCSPDGNQSILSSDALRVLRAAVGQQVTLNCPTE